MGPINTFCLEFMQAAKNGKITDEDTKERFLTSIKDCHANGYYLLFSKTNGWKLSNKKPESLEKQKDKLDYLVNTLFERRQ